jgi:hypothetical protein
MRFFLFVACLLVSSCANQDIDLSDVNDPAMALQESGKATGHSPFTGVKSNSGKQGGACVACAY